MLSGTTKCLLLYIYIKMFRPQTGFIAVFNLKPPSQSARLRQATNVVARLNIISWLLSVLFLNHEHGKSLWNPALAIY